MNRNAILYALASATISAAAIAHPGGGGGGEGRGGLMGGGGGGSAGGGGMDAASRGMGGLGGLGDLGTRGVSGTADTVGLENRDASRINSQALEHASQTGIAHANENSVLAGTTATRTVTSGSLAGLATGATLYSNGTAVGTVQQIRTTANGSVVVVVVKGTNGGLYAVPASKLAFSGGTLSTTARFAGINANSNVAVNGQGRANSRGPAHASATGIAHANSHSVLASAATAGATSPAVGSTRASFTTNSQARLRSQALLHASATGIAHANSHSVLAATSASAGRPSDSSAPASLTTNSRARLHSQGLAHASATGIAHANSHSVLAGASTSQLTGVSVGMPLFSNGTQVGTVVRVVTANGVITRVLVQGTNGRTYSLSPSTLTGSGGSLTTSTTLRGV